MKRLSTIFIVLMLLSVLPAEGFFNRDCSNLKKRTIVNQRSYEVAWDKYQRAYGDWQKSDKTDFWNPEAVNRLRVTFNIGEKILLDFRKYPKCLNSYGAVQTRINLLEIQKAKKDLDGNLGFALFNNYLPEPRNHLKFLK